MTTIDSKKVIIDKPIEEVQNFLCDLNNLNLLLPKNDIAQFEGSETACSFKVKGSIKVELELDPENTTPEKVTYKTTGSTPISFTLTAMLNAIGENQTEAYEHCEAQLNPFLKVMVEKQLGKLFDYIADRLPKAMEGA